MSKNYRFFLQVLLIGFWGWLSVCLSAREVVAKKDGVEVYKAPSATSEVLLKLNKDQAVSALERKGMFWQVKTDDGKNGYVQVMKVGSRGGQENEKLSAALHAAVQEDRDEGEAANMRTRSAVMGVRGLDDNDAAFAGNVKPNLRMVYAMEGMTVDRSAVEKIAQSIEKEVSGLYEKKASQ